MFKKENLLTTIFILLVVVLIGAAIFGALVKTDSEEGPTTMKTKTDMVFALEDQPLLGKEDALVTLTVFYDYNCPHCGQWEQDIFPVLQSDVLSSGSVNLRFVNYPFLNVTSTYAAMAGELVQDKNPENFVDFHNDVFSNQLAITTDSLAKKVAKYVPDLSEKEAKEIILNQTYMDDVLADQTYAKEKQVASTPSLFVGDVKVENPFDLAEIEEKINGALKVETEGEETNEVPEKE